jgi:hypothetical protein
VLKRLLNKTTKEENSICAYCLGCLVDLQNCCISTVINFSKSLSRTTVRMFIAALVALDMVKKKIADSFSYLFLLVETNLGLVVC